MGQPDHLRDFHGALAAEGFEPGKIAGDDLVECGWDWWVHSTTSWPTTGIIWTPPGRDDEEEKAT